MADLIDRDAAIRMLSNYAETQQDLDDYRDMLIKIPAVNRWIPCSERLPEIDVDVIVFYPYWGDKPIQVAHLIYDKITFELSDGEFNLPVRAVTHWMPLPEPPEKE